jgi:hypothetical protein
LGILDDDVVLLPLVIYEIIFMMSSY